jgi:clan AA aspartic protease
MTGHVDSSGRALLTVTLFSPDHAEASQVKVWIDTGFTGELVLPQQQIESLALRQTGTVRAVLADGSQVALKTFACAIDWLDGRRDLEVVANEGQYPLLGVGLLPGFDLQVSYRSGNITIG